MYPFNKIKFLFSARFCNITRCLAIKLSGDREVKKPPSSAAQTCLATLGVSGPTSFSWLDCEFLKGSQVKFSYGLSSVMDPCLISSKHAAFLLGSKAMYGQVIEERAPHMDISHHFCFLLIR